MFEQLKKFISYNDAYLTIIGLVIGVIGIILAFVFYFKSARNKSANLFKRSFNLLNDKFSSLNKIEVLYNQTKISRLTATKIAIWNSGDLTVDNSDIVTLDPITISVKDDTIQIYDIEVVKQSELSNNFSLIEKKPNLFMLQFDYIDKNQGCVVKVLHSGLNSSDIKVSGKLKGIGELSEKDNVGVSGLEYRLKELKRKDLFSTVLFITTLKIGWLMYLVGAGITLFYSFVQHWGFFFAFAFCCYASYVMYPRKIVPKSLKDIFSSEE